MKVWKVVMAIALASVGQVGIAMAYGNPDNGPGCGLGKLAWADFKRQKDIAPQVLMATTNGTFGSQTFGISFGTSGCTNDGKVWAEHKTEFFVAATFENLAGGHGTGTRRTSDGVGNITRRADRPPADVLYAGARSLSRAHWSWGDIAERSHQGAG